MAKQFQYKVYDLTGTFLGILEPLKVASVPSFTDRINAGQGEMTIRYKTQFDAFDESLINHMNIVETYAFDDNHDDGVLIHKGFISRFSPYVTSSGQGVDITVLGLVSLLSFGIFKYSSTWQINMPSIDVKTAVERIIDHFNTKYTGSLISRAGGNIDTVGTSLDYTYDGAKNWFEALTYALSYSDEGYWWRIDRDGEIYFKTKPSTATHTFTIGKDVEEFTITNDNEKVINNFIWYFDSVHPTPDVEVTDSDATSEAAYGFREGFFESQSGVGAVGGQKFIDKVLGDQKDPVRTGRLVINNEYDIETIRPGDTCKVRNFNGSSTIFNDNMQVVSVQYGGDRVTLQLDRDISFGKELEQLIEKLS